MLQGTHDEAVFAAIANDLRHRGYSILKNALPASLAAALKKHSDQQVDLMKAASVGRGYETQQSKDIRRDHIAWIEPGISEVTDAWLDWAGALQTYLNRTLYLGLFSFESHFARYQSGDFYQKHRDAFRGESNRIISLITYFNEDWQEEDGGELVIYDDKNESQIIEKVLPEFSKLVVFLSEDFPHEVKVSVRERYSIAGWFRLNASRQHRIDPPS